MTRLENVIEEVKSVRTGSGCAWIFDENGNIRDDVLVGDVLPLLEELKEYEIDITDEEIEAFINDEETKGDNTYNWNANISCICLVDEVENHHIILLPITMASTYALFHPLRIPRQIVIHDKRTKLKVDTFGCRLGSNHDFGFVSEIIYNSLATNFSY